MNSKATAIAPRCHFSSCKALVTHTVQRLWQIPNGHPFKQQHCCDQHIPGSHNQGSPTPFYRVERIK